MYIFKHLNKIISAFMLIAVLTACSSEESDSKTKQKDSLRAQNREKGSKKILTEPAGASIIYKGKVLGKTPHTLKASVNHYTIKLEKEGYRSQFFSFDMEEDENTPATITLEKTKASVKLTSSPSEATVIYNNRPIGNTPYIMRDLEPGTYNVMLKKTGHDARNVTFKIENAIPKTINTKLERNFGKVRITSSPSGASVYLNGKKIGITPFTNEYEDGQYKFKLKSPNHTDADLVINIIKGKTVAKYHKFNLLSSSFVIRSGNIKAKVFWNGKYIGVTPVAIKDQPPNYTHSVRLEANGYATQTHKVKTTPGKTETLDYEMKRNRGDLELIINPAGVTVFLNGKRIGVTQMSENKRDSKVMKINNLPPGTYEVSYTHRRAQPNRGTKTVKIKAGETTRPEPMSLWIPNAEIFYTNGSSEYVIITGETATTIDIEPQSGIRYSFNKSKIKEIKRFDQKE